MGCCGGGGGGVGRAQGRYALAGAPGVPPARGGSGVGCGVGEGGGRHRPAEQIPPKKKKGHKPAPFLPASHSPAIFFCDLRVIAARSIHLQVTKRLIVTKNMQVPTTIILFFLAASAVQAAPAGCEQMGYYVKELSGGRCSLKKDCMSGACKVNLLPQCTYTSSGTDDKRSGPCIEFGGSYGLDLCNGKITVSVTIPSTFWTLGFCGTDWTGDQKSASYSTTGYTFGTCTYSKIIESEKEVAVAVPDLYVGSKTFNLKAQVYLRGKR